MTLETEQIKSRSVYRMGLSISPHVLIMPPLLRPFRRSLSERTIVTLSQVVHASTARPFKPCKKRLSLSPVHSRGSRVLGCSVPTFSLATSTARPLPRADNTNISKKNTFCKQLNVFYPCFRVVFLVDKVYI